MLGFLIETVEVTVFASQFVSAGRGRPADKSLRICGKYGRLGSGDNERGSCLIGVSWAAEALAFLVGETFKVSFALDTAGFGTVSDGKLGGDPGPFSVC